MDRRRDNEESKGQGRIKRTEKGVGMLKEEEGVRRCNREGMEVVKREWGLVWLVGQSW